MEALIISTIALVVAIAALFIALRCREELRELKKSNENFFTSVDGVIYTKPQYKGLVSRGYISAGEAKKD